MNIIIYISLLFCGICIVPSNGQLDLAQAAPIGSNYPIDNRLPISGFPSLSSVAKQLERYFLFQGYGIGDDKPKVDLTFIIHGSSKITSFYFNNFRKFIVGLLRYFSISRSNTRVALVTYGSSPFVRFNFNKYTNRQCLSKAILTTPYPSGYSVLEGALNSVYNLLKSSSSGRRLKSRKLVFIITDQHRRSSNSLYLALRRILSIPYSKIFTIGVGGRLRRSSAFYRLGSFWRSRYYYQLRNPRQIGKLIRYINKLQPLDKCCNAHKKVVYDECQRRCYCYYGKMVNCRKVRKEFASMPAIERSRFLLAYKQLAVNPVYKTRFDNLRVLHFSIFQTGIHTKSQFLPWHRWYILELENLLQEIDCRITVPYWAWSLWSQNPWTAASIWGIGPEGLGGNGSPAWNCIQTGQFRASQYSIPYVPPQPPGRCLRRGFNGSPPDQVQVAMVLQMTDFNDFELFLRGNLHNSVHCMIGGTMCSGEAASAPEFFLHHGYIDKLWDDWQKKSIANTFVYFQSIPGNMQSTIYQRKDLLRLEAQPGCIHVVYDPPQCNNAGKIQAALKVAPLSLLKSIPRKSASFSTEKTRKLFKLTTEETSRLLKLENDLSGTVLVSRNAMKGENESSVESDLSDVVGFELNRLEINEVESTASLEGTDEEWSQAIKAPNITLES